MAGRWFQIEVPLGDGTTQILSLIAGDQARPNVAEIAFLPVDLFRIRGDVILDVLQEFVEKDLVRFKVDAATVAKAEVDRGSPARRLSQERLELAPGFLDLVNVLLLPAVVAVAIKRPASFQVVRGPVELAAISKIPARAFKASSPFPVLGSAAIV